MITRFALDVLAMAIFVSIVVLLGLALQPMPMVERNYATLEAFKGGGSNASLKSSAGSALDTMTGDGGASKGFGAPPNRRFVVDY